MNKQEKSAAVAERPVATTGVGVGGDHAPSEFSKDEYLHAYREMLLIRRFEEKAGQLYGMGLIGGFCHLYIGQEAVVVGLEAAAKEGDQRVTSYRDHGHMLACGMDPKGVMAERFLLNTVGTQTGSSTPSPTNQRNSRLYCICSISCRSERTEKRIWIRLARSNRSGAIDGRPSAE
jgi:TPP-dependent pyruvate/acetoin dehydrogenase alpha subunit